MPTASCVLFTGRAGAGKTTVGQAVADELRRRGRACAVLDEAALEGHLQPGPEALVWCCELLVTSGATAVVTVPIPARADRELLRTAMPGLVEVFLDAPPSVCADRADDRAARGTAAESDAFEEPYAPDLRVPTYDRDPSASVAQVISHLEDAGVAPHDPPHPSE